MFSTVYQVIQGKNIPEQKKAKRLQEVSLEFRVKDPDFYTSRSNGFSDKHNYFSS